MFAGSIDSLAQLKQRQSLADQAAMQQGAQQALAILVNEQNRRNASKERGSEFDRTLAERQAENASYRTARDREFTSNEEYRRDALRSNDRLRRETILANSRGRSDATANREMVGLMPQINEWAAEGGGDNPDVTEQDFQSAFPKTAWNYSGMAVQQARKARQALKALYHADLADAETMNSESRAQNMISQERTGSWDPERGAHGMGDTYMDASGPHRFYTWGKNSPDTAAIGEWTGDVNRLAPIVADIRKDRNRISRLTPDENGMYQATAPGWMRAVPVTSSATRTAPAIERTATNPTTGEKIILRNGQWIPLNQ